MSDGSDDEEVIIGVGDPSKWYKNAFGEGVAKISGQYSKEESEIVRKAVEEFCAVKQITVARLCSECDHKAELKGAWMEISRRLPNRSVQSVYRHGLRQLHPFKRGTWTEEEMKSLDSLVSIMGKKWAAIQQKLNRSADSCRDKHREMSSVYIRGRWKENEKEMLMRLIREHLHADPKADIKHLGKMVKSEGIKIPWSVITKKMGNRSRLSCFKKWQKMTGLFSPSDFKNAPPGSSSKTETVPTEEAEQAVRPARPVPVKETPTQVVKVQTHTAPTAGAAAALAATGALINPVGEDFSDPDLYLLSEVVSLSVSRGSEVDWDGFRSSGSAQERWNELYEEWQESLIDDSALSLPLSEIARLILDRKTSAQKAAETVEAIDLPNPESLHTREVQGYDA